MILRKDVGYFAAAHNLPNHKGGCANLHGHNYRVVLTIKGDAVTDDSAADRGMVVDFSVIKNMYKRLIHDKLDHAYIVGESLPLWYSYFIGLAKDRNTVDELLGKVARLPITDTTAENMAAWIKSELNREIEKQGLSFEVAQVELYETESASAIA